MDKENVPSFMGDRGLRRRIMNAIRIEPINIFIYNDLILTSLFMFNPSDFPPRKIASLYQMSAVLLTFEAIICCWN